ncbi:MAG TPA: cytochrome c [bacterium]|nr:cytochrome c [bacterium]
MMSGALFIGMGCLLAGFLLAVMGWRRTGPPFAARRYRVAIAVGFAIAGAAVVVRGSLLSPPSNHVGIDARRNPYPPTAASIAIGRRVYQTYCQTCHGLEGRGDGAAAVNLYPPPTDFMIHFASGHTHPDGRLFFWITYGMGGTGMPGFEHRLSDAERWHVINYLRTFTPTDR